MTTPDRLAEKTQPTPESVTREMVRIRGIIEYRGTDDHEDLLTYAKEVVRLRESTATPVLDGWEIDRSTASPILTYEKCSVIQDDQALYVMGLLQAAALVRQSQELALSKARRILAFLSTGADPLYAHPTGDSGALREALAIARPLDSWSEDDGDVLWWKFPITEAPYVGTPLDCGVTVEAHTTTRLLTQVDQEHDPEAVIHRINVGGWPGYHTHWTPITPAALAGEKAP